MKIVSIVLIILGEAFAIYAEMAAARSAKLTGVIFSSSALINILMISIGGASLIFGYMIGVLAFNNPWTIAVLSIVAILVIEPPLVYLFFKTTPGRGEILGFTFGLIGILATLLVKD